MVKKLRVKAMKSFITLAKKLGFPKKISQNNHPSKFLIISTTGVGDTLWGTPAIQAIKDTYPHSYLAVLASPLAKEVLENNPYIDDFFVLPRGIKGAFHLPILGHQLSKKRFDWILIFHNSVQSIMPLAHFSGSSNIVGIKRHAKALHSLLTHPYIFEPSCHPIDQRLTMAKECGAKTIQKKLAIFLSEEEKETAKDFLVNQNIKKENLLIGFQPGAQHAFKQWPIETFIQLGKLLSKRYPCHIIIMGNTNEIPLAARLLDQLPNAVSFAGKLSLRISTAILGEMDVFITNDTGPMHLALAQEIPTVALFAPTRPFLCGPYLNEKFVKVVEEPPTCSPCIRSKCFKPFCMEQISVDKVFSQVQALLKL